MFRKISGILILTFVALPSLVLVVWTTALVKTVSSPNFLSDLPIKLIEDAPALVDLFDAQVLQKPERVAEDLNSTIWMAAVGKVKPSPREFLTNIGVFDWMDTDLKSSLTELGGVLRGTQDPKIVNLNLSGLKSSLDNPEVSAYILKVFTELPECNELEMEIWQGLNSEEFVADEYSESSQLPACNPGEQMVNQIVEKYQQSIDEIPDVQEIYDPQGQAAGLLDQAKNILYSLIFPAIVLLIGALIIQGSLKSVLRWSGGYIIAGAIISWLPTLLLKQISNQILESFVDISWEPVTVGILNQITSSINQISIIMGVVGVVLWTLPTLLQKIRPAGVEESGMPTPTLQSQAKAKSEEQQTDQSNEDKAAAPYKPFPTATSEPTPPTQNIPS